MTAVELLAELNRLDAHLIAEDGRLRLRAPRGAVSAELQERLRDARADLLALLAPPAGPAPTARGPEAPLTAAQRRLWLHHRRHPDSAAYHLATALRLRGAPSPATVEAAVELVLERHEALRTVYREAADGPRQVVLSARRRRLPCCDLSALPPDAVDGELRRAAAAVATRPFDLESRPPRREVLFQRRGRDPVLVWTLHHISGDGLSLDLLLRELEEALTAGERGQPAELPAVALQYADFAYWQERHAGSRQVADRVRAWVRDFEGARPPELPFDRPPVGDRGLAEELIVPLPEGPALAALARRSGATPFAAALGFVAAWLARMGGVSEAVIGTAVAGRPFPGLAGVVGMLADLVPLRVALPFNLDAAGVIAAAGRVVVAAEGRADLPADLLIEGLGGSGAPPLMDVTLTGGGPEPAASARRLVVEPIAAERRARFDLALGVALEGARPELSVDFDRACFETTTVERLLRALRTLIQSALTEPGRRWTELALLAPAERHAVLHEWSGGFRPSTTIAAVHRRAVAAARRDPQRPAVIEAGGEVWTYGELTAAAADLARRLRGAGVGPEACVGLYLERGAPLVASWLGVLLAGGVCLPLDPAHPRRRIVALLADAGAVAWIAAAGSTVPAEAAHRFDPPHRLDPPRRRDAEPLPDRLPDLPLPASFSQPPPGQAAALFYTSGSTGRPKGVMVTHGGLAELVDWQISHRRIAPGDRLTHVAGTTFDVTAWEIWTAIAAGATLVLPAEEARTDPRRLAEFLAAEEPAWCWVPTAVAEELVRDRRLPATGLWTGGDRLRLRPASPSPLLVNSYGPTEATVTATAGVVEAAPSAGRLAPSLGRPIANVRTFVLDRRLAPVPPGFVGELCLGGAALARGYLGRPGLTAAAFMPDAVSGEPGARLYRTGDRVRHLADGRLHFLGRFDHQLEVRGHRIEPGEVEAALLAHPSVQQAAVAAPEVGGEPVLTAYVSAGAEPEVLRAWLRERLPPAFVPAAWVALEALPLSANGKLDRGRLPAPEISARPARDLAEQELVALWSDVLGVPAGRDTDFFAAGGSSLAAFRLAARIGALQGRLVAVETVLAAPTPAAVAAELGLTGETSDPWVELAPGEGLPLLLVPPPGGSAASYLDLAEGLRGRHPVRALRPAPAGPEEVATALEAAARAAAGGGPCLLGGWSAGGLLAFETARRRIAAGSPVRALVLLDAPPPGMLRPPSPRGALTAFVEFLIESAGAPPPESRLSSWDELIAWASSADLIGVGGEAQLRRWCDDFTSSVAAAAAVKADPPGPPAVLVAARRGPMVARGGVDAWRRSLDALEVLAVDADHHEVTRGPALDGLLAALGRIVPERQEERETA
ncbi:MAG: amino acid adenylation domain-containing protein [Acidobacteriota bacterium]